MKVEGKVNTWLKSIGLYTPGQIREGYIKLSANENNYGPSRKVVGKIKQTAGQIYRYPYKDLKLRKKIAGYVGTKPDNIIVGNGSDELMDLIIKTFKGDVCGLYPGFLWYKLVANVNGRKYYEIPLESDFSFDVKKFLKASKKTGIIFIDNPNNPTGTVIAEKDIKVILDAGKITVIDEAYFEFYGKTAIPLTRRYKNLIVLRTFAKAFSLAGLRVGYAIANRQTIDYINKVKSPFNVNLVAQEAALSSLEDKKYMRECVKKILRDRKKLYANLNKKFKCVSSEANFLLVDTSALTTGQFFNKLLKAKIIVRKFGKLKGFKGNYTRITIGTASENRKLLKVLKNL